MVLKIDSSISYECSVSTSSKSTASFDRRGSTARNVLSCLPVTGNVLLIYNLFQNYIRINCLSTKFQKLNDELLALNLDENSINNDVSRCQHAIFEINHAKGAIFRLIEATSNAANSVFQEGRNPKVDQANVGQTEIIGTRRRSSIGREIEHFNQYIEATLLEMQIVSSKMENHDKKTSLIYEQLRGLAKVLKQEENAYIRYWKYFLVSSYFSLAVVVSGLALGVLNTLGAALTVFFGAAVLTSAFIVVYSSQNLTSERLNKILIEELN